VIYGYKDGNGYGNGNGYGYGNGNGYGNGDGNGYGNRNGDGNGYGIGYGDGDGDGNGYPDSFLGRGAGTSAHLCALREGMSGATVADLMMLALARAPEEK
jgi:hypothetical protein